jgi:HD superfamily phosphodiesterase
MEYSLKSEPEQTRMTCKGILPELKDWFSDYVKKYLSGGPDHRRNIELKAEHSRRVCEEILDVGMSLKLGLEELCLAETTALLHDIGRFEQYTRYGTFVDLVSEDHAVLGIRVLREEGVLERLDVGNRELILRIISYHNRAAIPENETEKCLYFSRLLRDADKLDIWRVVTNYYTQRTAGRNETVELNLPDGPGISDRVYEDLMGGKIVRVDNLRTLNDFKVLQMGWVFDVNFPRTFQLVRERRYLEIIRDTLPPSDRVSEIFARVHSCLEKHCQNP